MMRPGAPHLVRPPDAFWSLTPKYVRRAGPVQLLYTRVRLGHPGLVDELGSLDDAIAYAKKQAGVGPDEKLEKLVLPKATSPLESLLGPLDPNADARATDSAVRHILRSISPELEQNLQVLRMMEVFSRERTLTVMPFRLQIR